MDGVKRPETRADLVQIKDPFNQTVRCYRVQGTDIYFPPFPNLDERLKQFPDIHARNDDILVCGYPKCGTHWIWEVVSMIVQGEASYSPAIKESVMMEAVSNASLDAQPSPRVLNTHVSPDYIPSDFINRRCKIVYLLRNPKDMLVSMYNHTFNLLPFYGYEGTWAGYFELFMEGRVDYGDWFRYVRDWENLIDARPDLPIHVLYYEDMKKDPLAQIRKLAEFLGKGENLELYRGIMDKCSFKNMKQAKASCDDEVEKADWREGKPMMYRKGEVGDWKNWFTVSQNERLEDKLKRELASSKLRFTYVL